jgi:hypothetical protein
VTSRAQRLLLLDGSAGLAVGVFVLALHRVLADLYGLPPTVLLATGAANLAYGAFSSRLARRARRGLPVGRGWIDGLIAANAAWSVVCAALVIALAGSAGPLGLAHLTLEGLFVGALAWLERRWVRPEAVG